jgi:ABC-2 type transport system permease protein
VGSILAVFGVALRDTLANRRSFAVQVALMLFNDITWLAFWALFFHRVGTIRGWALDDVFVLFAILLVCSGIGAGLLANARKVGQLAADGELDGVLALPVSTLGYVLVRRIDTALLGDLAFGPVVFAAFGHPTLERTAVFVLGSLLGSVVLVGFLVALGSLTLFAGGRGEQSDLGFQATLMLANYPLDVFGGRTRLLLFSVVPAGFVSGLPARLVQRFDPAVVGGLAVAAAGFAIGGAALFALGMRRYASGSLFGSP